MSLLFLLFLEELLSVLDLKLEPSRGLFDTLVLLGLVWTNSFREDRISWENFDRSTNALGKPLNLCHQGCLALQPLEDVRRFGPPCLQLFFSCPFSVSRSECV